jgi:hypothetical protein
MSALLALEPPAMEMVVEKIDRNTRAAQKVVAHVLRYQRLIDIELSERCVRDKFAQSRARSPPEIDESRGALACVLR